MKLSLAVPAGGELPAGAYRTDGDRLLRLDPETLKVRGTSPGREARAQGWLCGPATQ